jgi:hypothetical protein
MFISRYARAVPDGDALTPIVAFVGGCPLSGAVDLVYYIRHANGGSLFPLFVRTKGIWPFVRFLFTSFRIVTDNSFFRVVILGMSVS